MIRVIVSVQDGNGNAISTAYNAQDAVINFEIIQDKIIEDMVELSYQNKEELKKNIIKIKRKKLCKNEE